MLELALYKTGNDTRNISHINSNTQVSTLTYKKEHLGLSFKVYVFVYELIFNQFSKYEIFKTIKKLDNDWHEFLATKMVTDKLFPYQRLGAELK